jgi:selenocysteine-specific elongation factor
VERGAIDLGGWIADPALVQGARDLVVGHLRAFHADHPLRPGPEVAETRTAMSSLGGRLREPGLADALIDHLATEGLLVRAGTVIHLPEHRPRTEESAEAGRLVAAVADAEPAAPTVKELVAVGFPMELIRAVCADGRLVRVSPDLVVTPALMTRAQEVLRTQAGEPSGMTVSAFREAIGTSRKYALPMLEYFDQRGVTRRQGDVRVLRGSP